MHFKVFYKNNWAPRGLGIIHFVVAIVYASINQNQINTYVWLAMGNNSNMHPTKYLFLRKHGLVSIGRRLNMCVKVANMSFDYVATQLPH